MREITGDRARGNYALVRAAFDHVTVPYVVTAADNEGAEFAAAGDACLFFYRRGHDAQSLRLDLTTGAVTRHVFANLFADVADDAYQVSFSPQAKHVMVATTTEVHLLGVTDGASWLLPLPHLLWAS